MIIEIRTYIIKTGMLQNFIDIYDSEIRKTHIKILGNQIGFFYTEFGKLNKVIHLYGYKNFEDREKKRIELSKNKKFILYLRKVKDIIISMENELLKPTKFSKIK